MVWIYTLCAIICIEWPKGIPRLTLHLCKCYVYVLLYWATKDRLLQFCMMIHGAVHVLARADRSDRVFEPSSL